MRVAAELTIDQDSDERKSPRRSARVGASLGEQGKLRIQTRIVDLSSYGCRLEFGGQLDEGAAVWIKVPGMEPWRAEVVWSKRGSAGCRFSHPLHPAVVQRLADSASPDAPDPGGSAT